MCGIAGFFNLAGENSQSFSQDLRILETMTRTLVHRGPDDEGYLTQAPVFLGMRRLKVIDLEGGAQPVFNEDRSVAVVYNGEIYNYIELREELMLHGHIFQTNSDTEVLVHLYEQEGENFVRKLRGMFAFALWDARRRRLILGRDPFGIKPLYWGIFSGQLLFASEIKAILKHPAMVRSIDRVALDDYLTLMYIPAPRTAFENLWKLEPGHLLICGERKEPRKMEFWPGLPAQKGSGVFFSSPEQALEALEDKISECVRLSLRSDVPLGVFLSSGLDSSATAYFARKHQADLKTFHVYFDAKSFSEREETALIARVLGTHHTEIRMDMPQDAAAFSETVLSCFDEPFADTSALPTYLLCRAARQHVTVSLSGDGGDELFGGYPTFIATRIFQYARLLPGWLRKEVLPALISFLPTRMSRVSLDYKLKRFFTQAAGHDDWREAHFAWRGALSWQERRWIYSKDFYGAVSGRRPYETVVPHLERVQGAAFMDRLLYADRMTYLADEFLVKMDRMSMAHSLEVRPPLLDPELAELAWKIPAAYKVRGLQTKWILRKLMQDNLPQEILRLPKKGFSPPLALWFQQSRFQDFFRSAVSDRALSDWNILEPRAVETLLAEHHAGRADHHRKLWVILGLALFARRISVSK